MKASLKFREEKKPLIRAKVPVSVFGLPFQSGIVAGETKELSLNLSTFFESGPSIKIAYRPNDSWNPFSLIVKTGAGRLGSPAGSSMVMSAEFDFLAKGNPRFMLHFKPRYGDFSLKKSHCSSSVFDRILMNGGAVSEEEPSIEMVDASDINGCDGGLKKLTVLAPTSAGDIAKILSGMEIAARTSLPVKGRAMVNFRWGVRVPAEFRHEFDPKAGISQRRFPFLVMNKIGIEHLDGSDSKRTKTTNRPGKPTGSDPDSGFSGISDVKPQIEALQAENRLLSRAIEDLRRDISTFRPFSQSSMEFSSSKHREQESIGRGDRRNKDKSASAASEAEMAEEMKKGSKGSA